MAALLRRLEWTATREALGRLPTQLWLEAALSTASGRLPRSRLVRRANALRAVCAKLDAVALPNIGATPEEVRRRHVLRAVPRPGCPQCGGTGLSTCQTCGGSGRTDDDVRPCTGCAGLARETCPCCDVIDIRLPHRVHEGLIVAGRRGPTARPYLARLSLPARARPLTLWLLLPLGLIGLLTAIGGLTDLLGSLRTPMAAALQGPASVGRQVAWAAAGLAVLAWVIGEALRARQPRAWRPFSRASWLLGQAVAVALLGDICVQTVERVGETLYEGLAPESALAVLRGGVPAVLLVGGLALVRTPLVAGWFGERSSPSARYRAAIARPWEGLAAALTTRTGRALSVALLLVAGAAVLTVTQGRPYVIWAGGHTSERMGNYRVAVDRFRYLAKSQHPRLAAPARTHESVARYHRTAARLQQHSARDETEAAVQDVLTLKEDVSGLVAAHKELPAALQPKVPDVVAGAAEAFLDWRRWALAHEMFVILLRDFPASQYTRELVERAEWRLAAIEGVSNPYSVPSVPLSIARRSWEGADWEADYESLEPGEGNRLVVVAAKLVHIGRSRKELVADRFAMKGDQAGSYRSHGFQFDEMNTVPTDAGNIPVRMQSLKPSREFKGISVGPDPCRVRMVFEVPAAAGDLDLYLDGKKIADL